MQSHPNLFTQPTRAGETDPGTCESCGTKVPDKNDAYCHGCRRVICNTCSSAYEHWGNGLHGTKPKQNIPDNLSMEKSHE